MSLITVNILTQNTTTQGWSKDGPAAEPPRVPVYKGVLRCHWNNRKYGAGKLWSTTCERISLKIIRSLGICPQKCSPALFSAEEVERISV